jgi:HEPN domain-containing protein
VLDGTEYERWRTAAVSALRGADVQCDAGVYHWACFQAEQSAQLAVKGLLHGMGAGIWGHDLVRLGEAVASATADAVPDSVAARLRRLSRHYIPPRYPDAHPSGPPETHYGRNDASEALADAHAVLRWVEEIWSNLTSAEAAARQARKADEDPR